MTSSLHPKPGWADVSPSRRLNMQANRSQDTKPEMRVRQLVHGMGFRYRLHRRDLPGCPDLVFPSRKKAIFVHGCFWHQHCGCRRAHAPRSRLEYWRPKLQRNQMRDVAAQIALQASGWNVAVVWECETADVEQLIQRLKSFIDSDSCGESDNCPIGGRRVST